MSDPTKTRPDPERQAALINEISALIPTEVSGPWQRLTFNRRQLAMLAQHKLQVERPDGSVDRSQGVPGEVGDLLRELRKVMYKPGSGTWMSAQWTITNLGDGHADARATFDYDNEPEWSRPVRAFNYALDLEEFPRDPDTIPDWLARRLQEAGGS